MARNTVIHVITLLIIGIVICSAKVEFQKAIIIERPWATSYHIASTHKREEWIKQCQQGFLNNPETMKPCILKYVIVECMRRYPKDKKKIDACINELYPKSRK
ncbi:hypothetical protein PIB30_055643 [Stylosanthes scabra]|uniref:Uncharacterized protein n=1 Tax=Stylosanthes scabra TaxID=79078 RepID=A0ABU6TJS2_9FABA|nr:hypothetical protein [Stylosanthes scabra]